MSAFPPFAFSGSKFQVSRRGFLGGAAAAAAALPAAPLWADASSGASNVVAISLSGKQVTLTAADIKDLRAGFSGELLLAQDAGYDQARRVWNGAFDRHPALIARPANTADVAKAVSFARSHGVLTAVKGGGHSVSGQSTCDGGMMIDLGRMKDVQVDKAARIARAQGGVLLAELDTKDTGGGFGDAARYRGGYRHRGPHAGRRPGATAARTWPVLRQRACVRDRDGGRQGTPGLRPAESGALLGAARRRRQLRSGDELRVSAAPAGLSGAGGHPAVRV